MGQPKLSLLFICFATTYPCCPGGGLNTLSTASLPVAVKELVAAVRHVRMLLPPGKLTPVYSGRHHWSGGEFEIQIVKGLSAKILQLLFHVFYIFEKWVYLAKVNHLKESPHCFQLKKKYLFLI